MHKRKDGKVVASLTEVKNKTGDIFALVDEFGEVILTSYNKPKYRIVKVAITESVNLEEKPAKKVAKAKPKQSVIHKVKQTVTTITAKPKPVAKPEKNVFGFDDKTMIKLSDIKIWDRENVKEVSYILKIREAIQ